MQLEYRGKWFRIAGIAKRIKELDPPPHWRFEVEGDETQYLMIDFRFTGSATSKNNQPGVDQQAKNGELVAWISGFGNVVLNEEGYAEFTLKETNKPCPW